MFARATLHHLSVANSSRLVLGFAVLVGLISPCAYPEAEAPSPIHSGDPARYPIDDAPPKDFFDERLLRTLNREANAVVVCRLIDLVDAFPGRKEPDIFYNADCDVSETIRGRVSKGPVHFVWQVERGSRMPPRGAEILAYLKARKHQLDGRPAVGWIAVDTGVLRYTDALKAKIHPTKRNAP